MIDSFCLQPRLDWWPDISLMYSKAGELRNMFMDTVNKVTQGFSSHNCPKVSQGVSCDYRAPVFSC